MDTLCVTEFVNSAQWNESKWHMCGVMGEPQLAGMHSALWQVNLKKEKNNDSN